MPSQTGAANALTMPPAPNAAVSVLLDASDLISNAADPLTVIAPVLEMLEARCGLLRGTFWVLDDKSETVSIQAAHGRTEGQRRRGNIQIGEGITGRVVDTGEAAIVPRLAESGEFLDRTRAPRDPDDGLVCVPVRDHGVVVGALSAERASADRPTLEGDARLLRVLASLLANAVSKLRARTAAGESPDAYHPTNIVGRSKAMLTVFEQIDQVADADATVLLRGESGAGKELVAQALHERSARAGKPFVKVNCAALPQTLLESELFGHERGAFTGAMTQRKGRFELAQGGTIFLDEIGDLPMHTQVTLLRVLQEREFERVGGADTLSVDVRVITATNRDLEALIETEAFRPDLYYRLNVFPIHIPPLRERRADVLLLADHFIAHYAGTLGRSVRRISTPAIDMLMAYHWPGNVRELANCIERAVILTKDEVIRAQHMPPTLQTSEATGTRDARSLEAATDALEREMIVDALKTHRGNMAATARTLGLTERVMGLRVKKHGIDPKRFKRRRGR